jgi:hypothetical protein
MARLIATPIALVVAVLYFLIDAVFLPLTRPLIRYVEQHPAFADVARWLRRQGAYTTLFVVLVPLAILEPAKPIGFYLIATNHAVRGIALLVLAEIIKLALVERLFVIGKPKLMTIRLFRVTYSFVMYWLAYLKSLRAWQLAMRLAEMGKRATRYSVSRLRRKG